VAILEFFLHKVWRALLLRSSFGNSVKNGLSLYINLSPHTKLYQINKFRLLMYYLTLLKVTVNNKWLQASINVLLMAEYNGKLSLQRVSFVFLAAIFVYLYSKIPEKFSPIREKALFQYPISFFFFTRLLY